ncbi:50S ribosomal protein L23 [Candidatus Poribacteria bacterium]
MKDPYQIIRYPLITERSTILREDKNKYTFRVDRRANKIEIKKAITAIFPDVAVLSVNTINVRGKPKSSRYNKKGRKSDWKKAIVTLRPEDTIEIYETL